MSISSAGDQTLCQIESTLAPAEVFRAIYSEADDLGPKAQVSSVSAAPTEGANTVTGTLRSTGHEATIYNDMLGTAAVATTYDIQGQVSGYAVVMPGQARTIRGPMNSITIAPVKSAPNYGNGFLSVVAYASATQPSTGWGSGIGSANPALSGPNNNYDIPAGVNVDIEASGTFSGNTITVRKNGSGLPTTLKVGSMIGSSITITEGDTVIAKTILDSSVISGNNAGGLTSTFPAGDDQWGYAINNPGTAGATITAGPGPVTSDASDYAYFYIDAGESGTLTMKLACTNNFEEAGHYRLDGGDAIPYQLLNGNPSSLTVDLELTAGLHVLEVYESGSTTAYGSYFQITLSSWTGGFIETSLQNPSYIAVGNLSNSGMIVYGDTISIAGSDVSESTIINEIPGNVGGNSITIQGNFIRSKITYQSPCALNFGSVQGADISVAAGATQPVTIYYTGLVTQDITTSSASNSYVGTDAIAGYTAPGGSGSTFLAPNETVPAGQGFYVPPNTTASFEDLIINGFARIDGTLITNEIEVGAGGTVVVDTGGACTVGAFN